MTAIYYKDQKISYKELLRRIDDCVIDDPIFPVTKSLGCVVKILTCLIKGIPFFPYSPLLAKKPSITIPKDCDFVLHTSGSSQMKYALFTKDALLDSVRFTHPAFRLRTNDVYLLNLPLYHVAGLCAIMRAFSRAKSIAIEPEDLSVVTHVSMVPAMTEPLLSSNPYPRLKALLLGGSKIEKELADRLVEKDIPLYITYGMTEMCSHVFVEKYAPSVGVCFKEPLRKREICLKDGLLLVKGAGKFLCYVDGEREEYVSTKDRIAYDGSYITILDRADSMFISGGENIYPEEIEKALLCHAKIDRVEITTYDHMKWGKRPFVKIYSKDPTLSLAEIDKHLSARLERFKVPKPHEIALC